MGSAPRAAKCPLCRKPADGKFRPFCSVRCRDVDLHRWLGGAYVIPVAPDPDDWDGGDGTVPPETGASSLSGSVDEE